MNKGTSTGKQPTRGSKQIYEENVATVNFYFYLILITNGVYLSLTFLFFWDNFAGRYLFLFVVTEIIALVAYYFIKSMASPIVDHSGAIVDVGSDLNMTGHISEYLKDIIIFTMIVHLLSLIHNNFWFIVLVAPCYGFYLLWKNFLGPWFFAPAPEPEEDQNDKKKNKEKRKIVRVR
jgi:hypothetical protein